MKVLLASSPHADTFGYSMPPPGLLRLGAAVEEAGHHVALEDLAHRLASGAIEEGDRLAASAAELLRGRGQPDVLGLSVMGATLPAALLILEALREEWPEVPFLLGGPGVHGTDEDILSRFPAVDIIVRGEGEVTVPALLEALGATPTKDAPLETLRRIDGLTIRDESGAPERTPDRAMIRDLNTLPDYAWHLLPPITAYKEVTGGDDGLVPIDSGRGCAYDCSFCSIGRTWRRRSRPLPAARLAREISALVGIPGAHRAYLCHDLFAADRAHALELCDRITEDGIQVPWEVRARADHLDAELLQRMGAAGCDRVLLGIESASPRVRRRNQKGMSDDADLLQVVDDCAAAGITPILSLILGLPGEEDVDLDMSLEFCARAALRAGVNLSLHLVNPQPGCALGEELGAESAPVDDVPPDMALGAGLSTGERALIDAHPDLFSTWALLPYAPAKLKELVFLAKEFPETLMRFPRTFAALLAAERRARKGGTALGLARALMADGRTFETFAAAHAESLGLPGAAALVACLLEWELALVRVAARGPRAPRPGEWRLGAELVASTVSLGETAAALDSALGDPAALDRWVEGISDGAPASPRTFAVVAPSPALGRLAGVSTVALGAGAAKLCQAIAAATSGPDHERIAGALERPGTRAAAHQLTQLGVIVPPADTSVDVPAENPAGSSTAIPTRPAPHPLANAPESASETR